MKIRTDQRGQYHRTSKAYRPSLNFRPVCATRSIHRLRLVNVKALQFGGWGPAAAGATASLLIIGQPTASFQEVLAVNETSVTIARPWCTVAGLFQSLTAERDDTPMPFAVAGQTRKKYIIEKMAGEKIISRKQGITTVTCVGARPLSSGGDASFPADQFQVCRRAEAKEVGTACTESCQSACKSGIGDYVAYSQKFSGFALAAGEEERMVRSCTRRCIYECKKPADLYQFEVTNRR